MKRLDPDTILEEMLKKGEVGPEVLERVAETIAAFHKKAHTSSRIASFGLPAMIKQNTDENFAQTENHIGRTITHTRFEVIKNYTNGFIETKKELLARRVRGGFIRDCHGDIHSEHVSISDGIRIYDCIEFNERFRYSDTAADAAFLSMDLDFRNRHDLSGAFERAYFSSAGDGDGAALFDFYKCYRAFVRGKVEDFRLMEPEETEEDKREADLNARLYFHLAHLYATGGFRPTPRDARSYSTRPLRNLNTSSMQGIPSPPSGPSSGSSSARPTKRR
jgi:aminoglycoside phosphotransferase family enzyme